MKAQRVLTILAVILTIGLAVPTAQAQSTAPAKAANVVLVHGAWADGSSWLR